MVKCDVTSQKPVHTKMRVLCENWCDNILFGMNSC